MTGWVDGRKCLEIREFFPFYRRWPTLRKQVNNLMFEGDCLELILPKSNEITLRKTEKEKQEDKNNKKKINWRRKHFAICSTLGWPNCLISTWGGTYSSVMTVFRHTVKQRISCLTNHFMICLLDPSWRQNQKCCYSQDKFNSLFSSQCIILIILK